MLSVAHMTFNTSPASKLKIAVRDTVMVAPLLCRLATIVLPVTSLPLTRGQKRKFTVLDDDDAICAVKAIEYSPPSTNVISVSGEPV